MLVSGAIFFECALFFCSFSLMPMEQDDAKVEDVAPIKEGAWVVISQTGFGGVELDGDTMLYMAPSFLAISDTQESPAGDFKQTLLYDLKWLRDPNDVQKWTATLYTNPDPNLGLEKYSPDAILGYVTCWMSGNSGVVVFTEQEVTLPVASFQRLKDETSAFNIFSIYRKSDIGRGRVDFAREYLLQLTDQGRRPMRVEAQRSFGGWEHEVQEAEKSKER